MKAQVPPATLNRLTLILLTLLALALRIWALDAKGLAYDEAATALIARATPVEIIQFHWHASFEHPPFWQLLMYVWSNLAGQGEFALRFLPALAGVLVIPLSWQLAHALDLDVRAPWLSTVLVLFSPILLLYSQEARMYTIVVALALASLLAWRRLITKPSIVALITFLLINWAMLGFHYYSILLLIGEQLALAWVILRTGSPGRRFWFWFVAAAFFAVLPLLLWMAFSPGFRITASIVLQGAGGAQLGAREFLDELWRDLTFGAIRWQPPQAVLGYGLLPLLVIGILSVVVPARRKSKIQNLSTEDFGGLRQAQAPLGELVEPSRTAHERLKSKIQNAPWAWLPIFVLFTPSLISTLLFRTLATRYILFVTPLLYILIAVGIAWLWRYQRVLGFIALAVAGVVAGVGITYYFGPYQKSEYRQMAAYLTAHLAPKEGVLLEAPRQHLLAKYYLPPNLPMYTAPKVVLPAYWPISAPPVVPEEMDGQIQDMLRKQHALWLVLTAEDEVDKGEFVQKYLTAVAYKADCAAWLDVNLCYFISPHFVHANLSTKLNALWAKELSLKSANVTTHVTTTKTSTQDARTLLVQLNWRAEAKPTIDYRVTLRLIDAAGHAVSQRDDYPIGPLLPPSTWNAGDEKPGFMALPLPPALPAGTYRLIIGLYDPATTALLAYKRKDAPVSNDPLVLAFVDIGDKIAVRKP